MADLYEIHPAFVYFVPGRYGGHGLVNAAWEAQLIKDPQLQDLVLTVELIFGADREVRVATKPCSTTSGTTGRPYHFQPLLQAQPSVEATYSLGEGTSSARSFTVQIPSELVDPSLIISKNRMLAGVGEVALTWDGADYDERIVVIRGEMDAGVSFGPLGDGRQGGYLETTITDPRDACDISLPPLVIDTDVWPSAADSAIGQRYPLVIPGWPYVPGQIIDTGTLNGSGTYDWPTYLLCYGHMDVNQIYLDGEVADGTYYSRTIVKGIDANGNPYTAAQFGGTASFTLSEAVYAELDQPYSYDPDRDAGVMAEDPIGQISQLVRDYTLLQYPGLHHQLFAKASAKVGNMKSRVCVNAGGSSNTSTLSYIEGEFLSSFPMISMVWEGGRYGPVVTDRQLHSSSVAYLTAGQLPLLSRATVVQETPKTGVYNEFVVRFNYNAMDDIYAGMASRNRNNSILCRASEKMVGYRPLDVLDSLVIHDEGTANYVIDWMVAHLAVPSYYVEYACNATVYLRLQRGDNVKLTDSEFGWEEVNATVEKLTLEPGRCAVGLRVWLLFQGLGGGAESYNPTGYGVTTTDQD